MWKIILVSEETSTQAFPQYLSTVLIYIEQIKAMTNRLVLYKTSIKKLTGAIIKSLNSLLRLQ
jgi:hypothetical protein